MRVVIALGGNALLKRGEPMTAEMQRNNVEPLPALSRRLRRSTNSCSLMGTGHRSVCWPCRAPHTRRWRRTHSTFLGAQTEGMIGYVLEQELGILLPIEVPFATILTMIEVDPADPAFKDPAKFVGPVYDKAEADDLAAEKGWVFKQDGEKWRYVVPSPELKRIFEIRPIEWLIEKDVVVICGGGGGIPTMYESNGDRKLVGVEAVIDKDLASELLAREINADLYVMATDVDGVYTDWGTPDQRRLDRVTPEVLKELQLAAGSMGPKAAAAMRFVENTGMRAAIGALDEIEGIVDGTAGTQVVPSG